MLVYCPVDASFSPINQDGENWQKDAKKNALV
jgi:hypothetical protein